MRNSLQFLMAPTPNSLQHGPLWLEYNHHMNLDNSLLKLSPHTKSREPNPLPYPIISPLIPTLFCTTTPSFHYSSAGIFSIYTFSYSPSSCYWQWGQTPYAVQSCNMITLISMTFSAHDVESWLARLVNKQVRTQTVIIRECLMRGSRPGPTAEMLH